MTTEGEEHHARPPALELKGLARRFGWNWALRGVDLRVERGRLVALTGPNGAGKTTLLKVAATLLRPTGGQVRILGVDPSEEPDAARRRVGLLPAEGYLYDDLTARENLRFAALMSGIPYRRETAAAILERVGLPRDSDAPVRAFSSGMRKRLALARLLLRPPDLVLMDEPYASLDVQGVELVDRVVEGMRAEGRTLVLASHQWGRSLAAADRAVVLERGRVAWTGPPAQLPGRTGAGAPAGDGPQVPAGEGSASDPRPGDGSPASAGDEA